MVEALLRFLEEIRLAQRLEALAVDADRCGDNRAAQEYNQLWEILLGALEQLDYVFKFLERNNLFAQNNLYNVNIPENPQGIRITRQGQARYSDEWVDMGNGTYQQVGQFIFENTNNLELDTDCVMNGYISVTPLQSDRTNQTVFKKLAGYLNQ